jgi:hypothetical protein
MNEERVIKWQNEVLAPEPSAYAENLNTISPANTSNKKQKMRKKWFDMAGEQQLLRSKEPFGPGTLGTIYHFSENKYVNRRQTPPSRVNVNTGREGVSRTFKGRKYTQPIYEKKLNPNPYIGSVYMQNVPVYVRNIHGNPILTKKRYAKVQRTVNNEKYKINSRNAALNAIERALVVAKEMKGGKTRRRRRI